MACDTPFFVTIPGRLNAVPVPCGKCPPCKLRRVNSWVFRLLQEERVSEYAHFITLTYDTDHVPITNNHYMSLVKRDLQLFFKRLRKRGHTVRYYAVGEYGSTHRRPHYHAIIFGLSDVRDYNGQLRSKSLDESWTAGSTHIGKVSGSSIAYTCKYIDKPKTIPQHSRDDRTPEFSLMSKGLGKNYLTPAIIQYHTEDLSRNFVMVEGHKHALPKYYRNRLLDEEQRQIQRAIITKALQEQEDRERTEFLMKYPPIDEMDPSDQGLFGYTYECFKESQRLARYDKFYRNQRPRETGF